MPEYMPVMPAAESDKPNGASDMPQALHVKKKSAGSGKLALKQSTLTFGKKQQPMLAPVASSTAVVDLSLD